MNFNVYVKLCLEEVPHSLQITKCRHTMHLLIQVGENPSGQKTKHTLGSSMAATLSDRLFCFSSSDRSITNGGTDSLKTKLHKSLSNNWKKKISAVFDLWHNYLRFLLFAMLWFLGLRFLALSVVRQRVWHGQSSLHFFLIFTRVKKKSFLPFISK